MPEEAAISVKGLSKCYEIYNKPHDRIKQALCLGKKDFHRKFWALNDINLEIAKGETLGIVGVNGSGKSTLLQIICGTLMPTKGEVKVNGRIAALLELGAGFNPEFSGKENVMISAAILGMSNQEIEARYDDIVKFADIGQFIDQPVKMYSSGMFVRLAFAVAFNVNPDILLIDEALSVGDASFQSKCYRKLVDFQESGKTILFTSHATDMVIRHCTRAVMLDSGHLVQQGQPKDVMHFYLNRMFNKSEQSETENKDEKQESVKPNSENNLQSFLENRDAQDRCSARRMYNPQEYRWGSQSAEILDFLVCGEKENDSVSYEIG